MSNTAFDTTLYWIDPSKNMSRFYTLAIQPNLFGGHSLLRNWGRVGTGGQLRIEFHDDVTSTQEACGRLMLAKQKRGYRE